MKFGINEAKTTANCFYFEYPVSFKVDARSGIGREHILGLKTEKIQEGDLHSLILHDPSGALEVEASTHGFLTKEFYSEKGFKSFREVVLIDHFQNALCITIKEKKDFEIIQQRTEKEWRAIFLKKDSPEWGLCFQQLVFRSKDANTFAKFENTIDQMIHSFIPAFSR